MYGIVCVLVPPYYVQRTTCNVQQKENNQAKKFRRKLLLTVRYRMDFMNLP